MWWTVESDFATSSSLYAALLALALPVNKKRISPDFVTTILRFSRSVGIEAALYLREQLELIVESAIV
jgi:hypothetical protein